VPRLQPKPAARLMALSGSRKKTRGAEICPACGRRSEQNWQSEIAREYQEYPGGYSPRLTHKIMMLAAGEGLARTTCR
jgi:hypothetical protein